MAWFIYLMGVIWIGVGACYILYTDDTREAYRVVTGRFQRQGFAVMAFIVGALFVAAAFYSHHAVLVGILGAIALGKSVYLFFDFGNTYDALIEWYLQASDQTYRFFGIIMVVLGTALFSWA